MKKLEYNIYKCSSFTSIYTPENIKTQNSSDLSSRWSSESNIPPQYLILKLINPAIVKTVTFGKYEQTHVCNVKKFKIFGGLEPDNLIELLEGGLKNDSVSETFVLRHTIGSGMIPIRYIKIVPLVAWGPSFNFTLWFVEFQGIDEPNVIEWNTKYFTMYREHEIVRLCLKHFRQRNYSNALRALEQDTNVKLEDPLLAEFHTILVDNADYKKAESFLENAMYMGLFSEYIKHKEYQPVWEQIDVGDDNQLRPGMRGGHQMCIDAYTSTIYLFGGWDGNKDLNDLWSYNINTMKWSLLCLDSAAEDGPSARSCHKMCLDTKRKQIFMLGRYLDVQYRCTDTLQSDFFMYDVESGRWMLIAEDTSSVGGPFLIFDHQMCMDVEERILYVFGGRVLAQPSSNPEEPNLTEVVYSGLFAYYVSTSTWRELLVDPGYPLLSSIPTVLSRVGHSMLFHPLQRKLYIFAGQRNKEYLNDFITYQVDTKTVEQIYKKPETDPGNFPAPGFTQRATIDPDTDEIFVLSGLSKEKDKRDDNVQNSVWVYKIKENKWVCIYHNENSGEVYWKKMQHLEPCPRFAHQLVYDHINKIHYLFGGNPGRQVLPKLRLDDFWKLRLCKPTQAQLLQRCKFLIRKHNFEELARTDTVSALMYLRTKLSDIIDHQDPRQTEEFHLLASLLFRDSVEATSTNPLKPETSTSGDTMTVLPEITTDTKHYRRSKLYEQLTAYLPENMVEPRDVEDNIFKDEVPKLKSACTEVMNKLKETAEKSDSREEILAELKHLLQMYIDLLKLAHEAVKYISNKVQFEQVQSLPLPVCQILLQTFTHCKQSDTIYGDYFASLGELLTALFKKASEVQNCFLNLINTIVIFDLRKEKQVFVIAEVGRILSSIGEIVTGLDIKTAAEVWKAFIVFSQTHKDHLKSRMNIAVTLKFLSSEVTDTIPTIIASTDIKTVEKLLKLTHFNLKIIIKLCGLYNEHLDDAYERLFNVFILINRYTSPYLQLQNRSDKFIDLMHAYVEVATEPFLRTVLEDRQFIHCYFKSIRSQFNNNDTRLSATFLTISIMGKLISSRPAVRHQWLSNDPSFNVVCLILSIVDQLHAEFSLDLSLDIPVEMAQIPRTGSLYEFLLVHVCSMIVLLNEIKFKIVQKTLIHSMLQANTWKSIFVSDIWCAVGRYGSGEFCFNHVKFLLELFQSLNKHTRIETVYLSSIIARLYAALADNHKKQLAQEYSLTEYPQLWAKCGIDESLHPQSIDDVINVACQKIDTLFSNKLSVDSFKYVCDILELISNCGHADIRAKNLTGRICKLWGLNFDSQLQNSAWTLRFIGILFQVTAFAIEYFTNEELLKILRIITELVRFNTRIRLFACVMLHALTAKEIDDSPEQNNIFGCISSLFNALLKDSNPLVKQAALETFHYFAHRTSHVTILPATVAGDAKLQEEVSEYIQKIIQGEQDFTAREQYLQTQRSVAVKHVCHESNTPLEPQEKKKKLTNDINVNVIVQRMKHDCDSLVDYTANGGKTENITADISSIIVKLQSVLKN
ncbi:muskelin [Carabus blaptoides fortunei]